MCLVFVNEPSWRYLSQKNLFAFNNVEIQWKRQDPKYDCVPKIIFFIHGNSSLMILDGLSKCVCFRLRSGGKYGGEAKFGVCLNNLIFGSSFHQMIFLSVVANFCFWKCRRQQHMRRKPKLLLFRLIVDFTGEGGKRANNWKREHGGHVVMDTYHSCHIFKGRFFHLSLMSCLKTDAFHLSLMHSFMFWWTVKINPKISHWRVISYFHIEIHEFSPS